MGTPSPDASARPTAAARRGAAAHGKWARGAPAWRAAARRLRRNARPSCFVHLIANAASRAIASAPPARALRIGVARGSVRRAALRRVIGALRP